MNRICANFNLYETHWRQLATLSIRYHDKIRVYVFGTILALVWAEETMGKRKINSAKTVRMGMMRLGIPRPSSISSRKKDDNRQVKDVRVFAWKMVKDHYGFLYRAHKEDLAQEIEIIALTIERKRIKKMSNIRRLIRQRLAEYMKVNGWDRETTGARKRFHPLHMDADGFGEIEAPEEEEEEIQ